MVRPGDALNEICELDGGGLILCPQSPGYLEFIRIESYRQQSVTKQHRLGFSPVRP